MSNPSLPILIVGAGPVGLCLALALNRRGVPCHVFEALPELSDEARASTFHPATLEMFAEWGVIEPVLAAGHKVDRLMYWERETLTCLGEFPYRLIANDTPYPFRLQLPQCELTRLVKPLVEDLAPGTVHLAHTLTAFEQHPDGVEATFATPNGPVTWRGAYLCAADGARSTVRKQLNLRFDGLTYPDRFLLAATDLDFRPWFPALGPVNYIFDPEEWVIILHLPDVVRVVFQAGPDEDETAIVQTPAVRARLDRFLGRSVPYTIHKVSLYSVHQRVAETFRCGRILLAGDAAHINNPAGGLGMNSGIHDAHHLAEALYRVWHGGPETALDDYATARRHVAQTFIHQHTAESYAAMVVRDPAERQRRNAHYRALAADPAQARAFLLKAAMLEHRI